MCYSDMGIWVYSTVKRSRGEKTCLCFDGTAKPIYSAALLHIGISTEMANSHPFQQSAIPKRIDFSSIYNEKANIKKSEVKTRNHVTHAQKNYHEIKFKSTTEIEMQCNTFISLLCKL